MVIPVHPGAYVAMVGFCYSGHFWRLQDDNRFLTLNISDAYATITVFRHLGLFSTLCNLCFLPPLKVSCVISEDSLGV